MSTTYNDVLERLKEERCRLSLSQKEMGQWARMTQSNYSKVELGTRRLSYHELKYLCKSEADMHYVFTGIHGNNQYTEFFSECSYAELLYYLRIIYAIVTFCKEKERTDNWNATFAKVQYVPWIEEELQTKSIFFVLRRKMDWQQQKMAERLGVDIKKFRDLENKRCLPDSELLWRLYDMFHIPPAVILKDMKGLVSEVSSLVEVVEIENGKAIFGTIKELHEILN